MILYPITDAKNSPSDTPPKGAPHFVERVTFARETVKCLVITGPDTQKGTIRDEQYVTLPPNRNGHSYRERETRLFQDLGGLNPIKIVTSPRHLTAYARWHKLFGSKKNESHFKTNFFIYRDTTTVSGMLFITAYNALPESNEQRGMYSGRLSIDMIGRTATVLMTHDRVGISSPEITLTAGHFLNLTIGRKFDIYLDDPFTSSK